MTPTVYLDTSVISFLFATDAPELQAATLEFFERPVRERRYRVILSDFVVQELEQTTDMGHRARLLQVLREYPIDLAATRNGARAMGRDAEFGTVETGKTADLVIVGADPTRDVGNLRRMRWVVRGGVVRSLTELRAAIRAARD